METQCQTSALQTHPAIRHVAGQWRARFIQQHIELVRAKFTIHYIFIDYKYITKLSSAVHRSHLHNLKGDEFPYLKKSVPCVLVVTAQAVDKIHYEAPD